MEIESHKFSVIDGEKFLIFNENANDGEHNFNQSLDESSFNSDILFDENSTSNSENLKNPIKKSDSITLITKGKV